MGHLILMAFNSIIIILISHAHPWASMGKNVTVIGRTLTLKKWNVTVIVFTKPTPWASMPKNVTVIVLSKVTKK